MEYEGKPRGVKKGAKRRERGFYDSAIASLEVGHFFFEKCSESRMDSVQVNLLRAARSWAAKNGNDWTFQTNRNREGIKLWRIK